VLSDGMAGCTCIAATSAAEKRRVYCAHIVDAAADAMEFATVNRSVDTIVDATVDAMVDALADASLFFSLARNLKPAGHVSSTYLDTGAPNLKVEV
jgi:hypothetical protein